MLRYVRTLRAYRRLRDLDHSGSRADLTELRDHFQRAVQCVEERLAEMPGEDAA